MPRGPAQPATTKACVLVARAQILEGRERIFRRTTDTNESHEVFGKLTPVETVTEEEPRGNGDKPDLKQKQFDDVLAGYQGNHDPSFRFATCRE